MFTLVLIYAFQILKFLKRCSAIDEGGRCNHISVPRQAGHQLHRQYVLRNSEEYYHRSLFVPFVEYLSNELKTRFAHPICSLQELIPQFTREGTEERIMASTAKNETDLLGSLLETRAEVRQWLDLTEGAREAGDKLTLAQCLKQARVAMLESVIAPLRLFAVIPVTTAIAERSFSHLRWLKTSPRSIMTTQQLSGLAMMTAHRDNPVNVDTTVDRFRDAHPRRIALLT